MADMMPQISALREECEKRSIDIEIQVDGGISAKTIEEPALPRRDPPGRGKRGFRRGRPRKGYAATMKDIAANRHTIGPGKFFQSVASGWAPPVLLRSAAMEFICAPNSLRICSGASETLSPRSRR